MREIDPRVSALPNLESRSYRNEALNHELRFGGRTTGKGAVVTMLGGRRGYAVVEGRDIRDGTTGDAVVERGLAREWGIHVGDRIAVTGHFGLRVVGIAISPDNVAYPLASAARVYVTAEQVRATLAAPGAERRAAVAQRPVEGGRDADPGAGDDVRRRASCSSSPAPGVEILLSQAAGIVISLLIAFSLVALVAAGTMLAAGAHADVQRRLTGLGVQRALGFGPGRIAAQQATEATLVAVPAAALGIVLGALIVARPAAELLAALNELGPGAALAGPLAIALGRRRRGRGRRRHLAGVARGAPAADRDPARRRPRRARRARGGHGGGLFALGVRFSTAARARWLAAVATIAVCAGRRDADARARVAARAAARGPGDDRQALPDRGRARPVARERSGAAARRGRRRRALQRRRRRLVPARRAGAADRLPRRPHASSRRRRSRRAGGSARRARSRSASGWPTRSGCGRARCWRRSCPTRTRCGSASSASCARSSTTAGSAGSQPDRLLAADPSLRPQVVVRVSAGADPAEVTRRLVDIGAGVRPRRRGADRQRRIPGRARRRAARRRVRRRAGVPVRAGPGADRDRARAPRRGRRPARQRRRRADGRPRPRRARRWRSRSRPRSRACCSSCSRSARSSRGWRPGFASLPLTPTAGQIALVVGGLLALAAAATAVVARRVLREPIVAGLREE